jgi:hypothetical protein
MNYSVLSSHLCLSLPSGLIPPGFPTKILQAFLLSRMSTTRHIHIILFDFIVAIILHQFSFEHRHACDLPSPAILFVYNMIDFIYLWRI